MRTLSATQVLFAALFVIKLSMPAAALAGQRTGAVVYKNQVIPSVELKGVEISASRPATLCTVKEYNGELIPSVEMNEVTISASGEYKNDKAGIRPVTFQGIRTGAIAWRGKLIPHVEAREVTIEGQRLPVADMEPEGTTVSEEPVFNVSVRHAFDRVGGFLVDQGKEMVRKLVNIY